jgi:hypothetical protein
MRGALLAGVVLAALLGGCGKSDEAKVKDATNGFVDAIRKRDGERACSYLTTDARTVYGQLGDLPCSTGVLAVKVPSQGEVKTVRIRGKRATANLGGAATPSMNLVKQGDSWRIDGTS